MREINVTVEAYIDPRKIDIECREASAFCSNDLKCDDCPFNIGSYSVADLIHEYTDLIAKEARHD